MDDRLVYTLKYGGLVVVFLISLSLCSHPHPPPRLSVLPLIYIIFAGSTRSYSVSDEICMTICQVSSVTVSCRGLPPLPFPALMCHASRYNGQCCFFLLIIDMYSNSDHSVTGL